MTNIQKAQMAEAFNELLRLVDGPSAEDLCFLLERLKGTPDFSDVKLGISRTFHHLGLYATDNKPAKPPRVGRNIMEQVREGDPFAKRYFDEFARRSGCRVERAQWELLHRSQYSGGYNSYGSHDFPYPNSHFLPAGEDTVFTPVAWIPTESGKSVRLKIYIKG
ncbi:MAG: hypothetical protein HY515_03915 [Candidatus Aenigmarchaeota archaeon]|nr:hypothetical protein [Candidatus Aenigmarchaeota archaeon]